MTACFTLVSLTERRASIKFVNSMSAQINSSLAKELRIQLRKLSQMQWLHQDEPRQCKWRCKSRANATHIILHFLLHQLHPPASHPARCSLQFPHKSSQNVVLLSRSEGAAQRWKEGFPWRRKRKTPEIWVRTGKSVEARSFSYRYLFQSTEERTQSACQQPIDSRQRCRRRVAGRFKPTLHLK